jgi:hypothetical protein
VTDRNRITGRCVTAGLDFAFDLVGPEVAEGLELMGEYDPQPATPFGSPDRAPAEMVAAVRAQVRRQGARGHRALRPANRLESAASNVAARGTR